MKIQFAVAAAMLALGAGNSFAQSKTAGGTLEKCSETLGTLAVVEDYAQAIALFNQHSPRFIASLISDDPEEHARFFAASEAPFVGDGLTRWVDGQYALRKPELGLTNWQAGRLFGRGGILTGDTVYTVRTRYVSRGP